MRKFYEVNKAFKRTKGEVKLPTRSTSGAMAYDFYANDDYIVRPKEICKIWTDVKAEMNNNEGLILNVRSSMGGKFMLANTLGYVDGDYFENPNNDGNIGVFLLNISDDIQNIHKGDRIAQGMFINFLITDDDDVDTERVGGFGSTGK